MNIWESLSSAAVSRSSNSILPKDSSDHNDFGIRESSRSSSRRVKLLSLGRVLNILLDAEPRELDKVRAQLRSRLQPKSSVGKAALALIDHVLDTNSSGSAVEQIFIPILEHVVKSKEHSNRKRSVSILQWLLESEEVGVIAASNLAAIIGTQELNNRVKLGWCVVVREVVQAWSGQGSPDSPLHNEAFAILVSCIQSLENIVRVASVQEDNKMVPTRLSIVAADCMLAVTKAVAVGITIDLDDKSKENLDTGQTRNSLITPIETISDDVRSADMAHDDGTTIPSTSSRDVFSSSERRNMVLWEHLDNLVSLVNVLYEWNYRSRPLFAKGLERVQKRVRSLAHYRDSLRIRAGEGDVNIGAEVLVACWQHYGGLLMTEDRAFHNHPQPVLQHWLGALQYYMQETEKLDTEEETRNSQEMRGYALACLTLTLGRLDARRLEAVLEEFEPQLLNVLFSQLRGGDNTIVELAVGILRAILFRQSLSAPDSDAGSSVSRLETVVPMLMEMLDTRDLAARAVVLLVAEYFAANPEAAELGQLFSRLDAEESLQRRNALDVLTELLYICTRKEDMINSSLSQTIATHLFKRLGDTELTNRAEASALFASLDPSFTLPTLVERLYSPDGRVRSAASAGVLSVLKRKTDQCCVIAVLLDCVTKMVKEDPIKAETPNISAVSGTHNSAGSSLDVDRVMRLIPDWASQVDDWSSIIHFLLKKMFDEPANAVIPRFLSAFSCQLAENTHILFPLLLQKLQDQSQLSEAFISKVCEDNSEAMASHLFERLSPLLVLRVLPLNAFNDITCTELYGRSTSVFAGNGSLDTDRTDCITDHLLNRACGGFEFEDVRKVGSEITGRLVPEVMLPLVTAQLEDAPRCQDLLRVKACLYALCTSLAIRGKDSVNHSLMGRIRKILSTILLWPCVVEEKEFSEVAKAQLGAIDCLALMICAETQAPKDSLAAEDLALLPSTGGRSAVGEDLPETGKLKNNPVTSRPLLEIVEEPSFDEESVEEVEKEPSAIQAGIQLIEKLPESEQLKMRPFPRKEVSLLSRGITDAEKVEKELSNKRIQVLDRLSELEQYSEESFGESQLVFEPTVSLEDVPELERNDLLASGKNGEEKQRSPVMSKLLIEELPDMERREQRGKGNNLEGVTRTGFQPKVLIEELPESNLRRRKPVEGGSLRVNDHQPAVLVDVVDCLTGHTKRLPWSALNEVSGIGGVTRGSEIVPIAFRICMANVLISASQKVPLAARTTFAAKMIPPLATFIQTSNDSKLKAACLQVLFTAVYHLKASAVVPFASYLMTLSLGAVQSRGPLEERMGGAKLLASLLASEDVLVRELAPHLTDAQVALTSISRIDSSPELRMLCEKLLSCMSVPGDSDDV